MLHVLLSYDVALVQLYKCSTKIDTLAIICTLCFQGIWKVCTVILTLGQVHDTPLDKPNAMDRRTHRQ